MTNVEAAIAKARRCERALLVMSTYHLGWIPRTIYDLFRTVASEFREIADLLEDKDTE